ncbi:MAG: hypothetical protein RMJ87_03255 [Cytophagales bacterium]|nr:hypothetical protein [Bernardetiaceae bacterium]MDW8204025.1 hypothetical protein [Cytophagales bacterium]
MNKVMLGKLRKWLISGEKSSQQPARVAHASWETINGRECLVITFNGVFTEIDAEKLVAYLNHEILAFATAKTFPLICRCQYMTDYEAHARLIFQNFIHIHSKCIESIWIVTKSNAIKYGGKLMGMFIGIPLKVVEEESQIYF